MASNKNKALEIFIEHKGEITNRKIAEILGEKEKTISAWKSRGKWKDVLQKSDCSTTDKNVVLQGKKCSTTKKKPGGQPGNGNAKGHGAPQGNNNAKGNNGGAPVKNHNALTHGLYAKYLPPETLEIAQGVTEISPLDILWGNITIQYAAIIRAQKIMEVESKQELIKELKTDGVNSTTYELQYAWDRQAAFMTAQSKAMTTLNNMIKQYDELCKSDLATEEQRLRVEKLKLEIAGQSDQPDNKNKSPYSELTNEELKVLAQKWKKKNL